VRKTKFYERVSEHEACFDIHLLKSCRMVEFYKGN